MGRQKFVQYIRMLYLGFIDLNRTVGTNLPKNLKNLDVLSKNGTQISSHSIKSFYLAEIFARLFEIFYGTFDFHNVLSFFEISDRATFEIEQDMRSL